MQPEFSKLELEVIYQDDYLVAINKPHGLLVHRSKYADEAKVFAVQELRNQLDRHVFPCHRLDRKTSGVLLFALDGQTNSAMQQQFAESKVIKTYLAIVRGHTPQQGKIDYPLINDQGKEQDAITNFTTLAQSEVEVALGKFPTSRYSLVKAHPETGRMHQIRKHFAHIFHPIIGDRPHGCNKQNKLFKEHWNMTTMMLHASTLKFMHPITGIPTEIEGDLSSEFKRVIGFLQFDI